MPLLSRPRPSHSTVALPLPEVTRKALSRSNSGIDLTFTLKNAFGKESFRGCQREVIEAALEDHDVFVLAPTGMGKSLCYQLPALASNHGLTLVVSPLLALMQNQVSYLQSLNLPAATLNSTISSTDRETIYKDLNCGHPRNRLLYITPELAAKGGFRKTLEKIYRNGELSRFVIDEAHCVSEWGHDFRKDYRSLSYFRLDFPKVPIMALTATATDKVRADVIKLLRLGPPRLRIFQMSFNRPNLHYEVQYKPPQDPYPQIVKLIRQFNSWRGARIAREDTFASVRPVSGIIYSPRRALCDSIAARLNSDGIQAAAYHAGLESKDRERVLDAWVHGKSLGVVVATVAFGMGVDKADVRFVIHCELPKSIEAYYQESGRAGRDQKTARCILFYAREDVERTRYLITQEEARRDSEGIRPSQRPGAMSNFEAMVNYCENATKCRHRVLCEYFGDVIDQTHQGDGVNTFCDFACDICRDPEGVRKQKQEKLTPAGSQEALTPDPYPEKEVEMFQKITGSMKEVIPSVSTTASRNNVGISARAPLERDLASNIVNVESSKRKQEEQQERLAKRTKSGNPGTDRPATVQSLLDLLQPLSPQNPEESIPPHLLLRTAERLESDLFNRTSKDRSVNALGRSSTLLSAPRRSQGTYMLERDKLLEKVRSYVNAANEPNVDIEKIQQGEIWDVIKDVLEA